MKHLSRRSLLRGLGLAGLSMALPPLELFGGECSTALAATSANKRLVFFLFPNGCMPEEWTPLQTGSNWNMTELLTPLEPFRSRINVVTGLSNRENAVVVSNSNPHAITFSTFMTGVPMSPQGGGGGISVDQAAAQAWQGQTPFSSLVLGCSKRNSLDEGRFSYSAAHTAVDIRTDPGALFDSLFGAADPSSDAARRANRRRSVLDQVGGEISKLHGELGSADKARLDEHLSSVRDLERQLETDYSQCSLPQMPNEIANDDSLLDQRADLLMQLGVIALQCNLTRVLVISLGSTATNQTYPFLGITDRDHEISHLSSDGGGDARQVYRDMVRWKVSKFARLLELLESTQIPEGNLLESSLTACLSEMSTGPGHFTDMLPVITAGGGMNAGQHLVYPCGSPLVSRAYRDLCSSPSATPLANLWLTMMRGAGMDLASFGNSTGTLPGLWV